METKEVKGFVRPDALSSELEVKVVKEVVTVKKSETTEICPSYITQYYG